MGARIAPPRSPLRKERRLCTVQSQVGSQDARVLSFGIDTVTVALEGHALALVEVVGPCRLR